MFADIAKTIHELVRRIGFAIFARPADAIMFAPARLMTPSDKQVEMEMAAAVAKNRCHPNHHRQIRTTPAHKVGRRHRDHRDCYKGCGMTIR
jgi:hypothetical protein